MRRVILRPGVAAGTRGLMTSEGSQSVTIKAGCLDRRLAFALLGDG
ncbi:hypothetical protein AB0901_27475 [Streptomyces roseifaciens]